MQSAKYSKRDHEKFVCNTLIKTLELEALFDRFGNDSDEPDCLYKVNHDSIGIEVVTVYCKNEHAKQMWTVARGERQFSNKGYEWKWGGPTTNASEIMCKLIQKEINDKCRKNYIGAKKIWLCIQETSPFSTEMDITGWLQSIKIPKKHSFDKIYLLHHAPTSEGGNYKTFEL